MAFLIRTIDFTATGREIVRERVREGSSLTIGRAAQSDIHLPDLAVELHHARIEPAADSKLQVAALGTLGFTLDGRKTTSALVDPREGAELALGRFLLTIAQDGGGDIAVTIRQQADDATPGPLLRDRFSLAAVLPGKRAVSWGLALAILLAFLAVPIATHLMRERVEPDYRAQGQVVMDASWNSGALSLAHHGLSDNCEACHVDAFVSVRDQTCRACHDDLGDHAQPARLDLGRAPHSLGEGFQWAVAGMMGKEGPGACTACHSEHEGPVRMAPASQQMCADCHGSMDARLRDTQLGNASDFGTHHPEFRAAIFTRFGQDKPQRLALDTQPKERSGLKFPHKLHLDAQGGVARMAIRLGSNAGYGAPLDCRHCHEPNESGIGFAPVSMESACESCHSLVYDRVGPVFRKLQHGDVEQVLADLRAMDRTTRPAIVTGRARPDRFARGGLYHADFGMPLRSLVGVERALASGGVCGECHLPARRNGRPDVMPVNLPDRFFLHGAFDHHAHRQEECSSCHAAETSRSATDLLLPDLASCRECHEGETVSEADVPSSCAMCHSYHAPGAPMHDGRPGARRDPPALVSRKER